MTNTECTGAHCKCMQSDCPNLHNGDHTCKFAPNYTEALNNHPTPQEGEDELRDEINKIHGRLHGRLITHAQVAKHSRWSPEELQNVQIEDEYLFIDEIVQLIETRVSTKECEARIDAVTKIMNVKTEGLFNNGDLFIKRAPIEQAYIDLVGYEAFKAIKESIPTVDLNAKEKEV